MSIGDRETSVCRGARLRALEAAQRAVSEAIAAGDSERVSQLRRRLAQLEAEA